MTPEQLERQPKYVQDRITQLERALKRAEEKVRQLCDTQTETGIWVEDSGADKGQRRHFVQGDSVVISNAGVCLYVRAYRDDCIELSWSPGQNPYSCGDVAFIPTLYQQARIVSKENLR